ncbi:Mur ligase family protein [Candidatus Saccharibacteria bacterium]|nr:Mur ligase family protein [Candidatus Saccharibacteria bacterium]MCL1962696.1 Mur ligase family protein [Candidatus Saccharibacteria bacterium]
MTKKYLSRFTIKPDYGEVLLYMLQQTEYDVKEYLKWLHRVKNFRTVIKRQSLVKTKKIRLLDLMLVIFTMLYAAGIFCLVWFSEAIWANVLALVLLLILPLVTPYVIIVPLVISKYLIQKPAEKKILARAKAKLAAHPAAKIAVVGSYGKTTAKEVLRIVLSAGKKVAATPGNINQPLGIAKFVDKLNGDEDILIIEMGEFRAGDITKMCDLVGPDIGFITGVSEAHLATFGNLQNIVKTLFELRDFLGKKPLYLNGDNDILRKEDNKSSILYSVDGLAHETVKKVEIEPLQTKFTLGKYKITSQLIGRHNIGIVAAAVDLAEKFGMSAVKIEKGLKDLIPFEHRMQPVIVNGAIVIDDTYNGNLMGVTVGVNLVRELDGFKRKIYVTPGLVEQGDKTRQIHVEIGKMLADTFDVIVLMQNSVTDFIIEGLKKHKFAGELLIEDNPLKFYQNLDKFVAVGDLVLMQNDWTDNYA